jgi:hypothetical protein
MDLLSFDRSQMDREQCAVHVHVHAPSAFLE